MVITSAPQIAQPTNTGPISQYLPFQVHVENAFALTGDAITNLTPQQPGVQTFANPFGLAVAAATAAVKELGFALNQDAPTAGFANAQTGLKLIEQGAFEMTHRLNGPLNTDHVISTFSSAQKFLQTALDSLK